jgi:NO-binding membrane sensor protein with MHYT domain
MIDIHRIPRVLLLTVSRIILTGASVSMGGISIWCMHFIGNRAIILGDGSSNMQISYGAGFTSLSFFLPIMVLFLAFVAVGINEEIHIIRLIAGGTLAGLGICGMHYLGQASITNYTCIYSIAKVIGSAIIAIAASMIALGTFFIFRSAWSAAWWKRAICAAILAGAVSGMHWVASVGTEYRLRNGIAGSNQRTRDATTISVIVLVSDTSLLDNLY